MEKLLRDIKVGDVFYGNFSHTKLKVLAIPNEYSCCYLVYDFEHDWEDVRTPERMLWELGYDTECDDDYPTRQLVDLARRCGKLSN